MESGQMVFPACVESAIGLWAQTSLKFPHVTNYSKNIFVHSILCQSSVTTFGYNCAHCGHDFHRFVLKARFSSVSRGSLVRLLGALLFVVFPLSANPTALDRAPILEALGWMRTPPANSIQFDYVMTARVRLLFFWAGKDDVGGGFIRRGVAKDDPHQELLQVLFGSDPAKAPRAINRWGAGTEVVWHRAEVSSSSKSDDVVASAFFGFMKGSKGKSVSEMQDELKKEKDRGEHQFTGILSRVDAGHAISLTVPLASNIDFNLHQYAEAEPLMLEKLSASERPARVLRDTGDCSRAGEFLGTVAELLESALQGNTGPLSLCYVYDAQLNTLTIEHAVAVPKLVVKVNGAKGGTLAEQTYTDLLETDFVSTHKETGKRVFFAVFVGRRGDLRGVPVQIRYQPNWWFQVVLNLLPRLALSPNSSD